MKRRSFLKWTLLGVLCVGPVNASFGQEDSLPASGVIPGRYIVVLKQGADHGRVAGRHGLAPDLTYTHALNGFAGQVPPGQLRQLQNDPDVVLVEPDQVATIVGASGKGGKPSTTQTPSTGVRRINLDSKGEYVYVTRNLESVGIAIIDTGIDLTHPDLNVQGNVTYVTGTRSGNDDNGHGTHCAGIAAAIDNGKGVLGVAPNARLYAVKVLNRQGSGAYSAVIAGVEWVTINAATIKVANMSLGGPNSVALNDAIANSVKAGVTYCVAAGNETANASTTSPANCEAALAVSAIADYDGLPGNDTFATFSNFGPFVHIAAPGVNIYSTYKGGSYTTMSGTSMAAPHVTGAAALYIAKYSGFILTPLAVMDGLIALGTPQTEKCGFTGDPDLIIHEPLVNAFGL